MSLAKDLAKNSKVYLKKKREFKNSLEDFIREKVEEFNLETGLLVQEINITQMYYPIVGSNKVIFKQPLARARIELENLGFTNN